MAGDATRYDVFLSFRGLDTRDSITDHIYAALVRAGLHTFRDNDEIDRGRELKPEIEQAIKASEASIIVFSINFATSTWCLDELSLILQQRSEFSQFVLPVFYHVDPSDVRKQEGSFKIEVSDSPRWTADNVNKWKTALSKAADLTGEVLKGSETEFVKTIVDIIYNKQTSKKFHLPLNLVRMDIRYEEINSWINQSDVNFLVIWGMGGSGKTTLARYIVYSNRDKFENISVIEHIGRTWKEPHHLLELKERLLGGVLGGEKRKIHSDSLGTGKIEEALKNKKALIVLDEIDDLSQLEDLLGNGTINKESKIVVTTRETNIVKWFESRSWKCREKEMRLLDNDESLELFSLHAFGTINPMEGYKELAQQVVQYCEGNPLALSVLGSSFSDDISISDWESKVKLFEREIHRNISSVLIRSYDLLPHRLVQELFLHIACFFNGADMDYVVKILEKDCSAVSNIKTLTKRCLLSISPNQKIIIHPLLQEMGRNIVEQESPKEPSERSRVWRSMEAYEILRKGTGSRKVEGLALDMQFLREEKYALKKSDLKTETLKSMDNLKLLYLKYVEFNGSYKNYLEDLRWLCWIGFHLRTIPSDLSLWSLVALDMTESCLEIFELPTHAYLLKILNLKDSFNLLEIRNLNLIPNLETLILWNCHNLVHICDTIGGLECLSLLQMTKCAALCNKASTFRGGSTQQSSFSLPRSLERLFLNNCNLECTDHFPSSFTDQLSLQYLNLSNNGFTLLPSYNHLGNLRVLDLSSCSKLKCPLCLPNTLAELYIHHCESLEKVSFESHRFSLQELGCNGCTNLSEIEGLIKLVPLSKLDKSELGHMRWLKDYRSLKLCLAGYDELTNGRSQCVQVLYEFGIMSTSLPDIKIPNMAPVDYLRKTLTTLSFKVPQCPKNKRLEGLNMTFRYSIVGDNLAWFAKVSSSIGGDLIYNPIVFGRPASGEVGIWLSYWPIGNMLYINDVVNVSIVVISGLEVCECGASLVYTDKMADKTLESRMGWVETLGGDLSAFQLTTGAFYLCRRDFFELMEVDNLTPSWFRILVGGNIDHAEVHGWRKVGQYKQLNSSFTELKTVRCNINGPESDESYKIAELSRSCIVDNTVACTSNIVGEAMNYGNKYEVNVGAAKESEIHASLHYTKPSLISMASGSTPTTMASPGNNASSYDIFLNIRGKDTRSSFADHLYVALHQAGFRTFRDNDEFTTNLEIKSKIERAIKESKVSVVVLSSNYASSFWCLEELLLILQKRRDFNHYVLPVFYRVNPSDVREQKGSFNIKVKTSSRWTDYNVKRWKTALTEVANITGMVLSGSETEFLAHLVDTISMKLDYKQVYLPSILTGMDARFQDISSWLNQSDAEVLTICGMGGSGKTTLAKYIVHLNMQKFENFSILEDIGSRCEEPHNLLQLQEKLLHDILGGRKKKILSVHEGILKVEEALQWEKTLIVLDDIVEEWQLEAFLGTRKFINNQSKIIITTRDVRISRKLTSRSWRCREYNMELLNDSDAIELFSLYAFKSKIPMQGYEVLAEKAVRYCEGNPLAIKELGFSLSNVTSIPIWESKLNFLESNVDYKVNNVLMKSYNSLPRHAKELFLHIACFFTGEDVDYVVKISEHDCSAVSGIKILTDRCLLSGSPNKKLMMHPLLQKMGRDIVYQESPNPSKRSRVWRDEESYGLLKKGRGSEIIIGLALDMSKLRHDGVRNTFQSSELKTDALEEMNNLTFLQLKFVRLTGSYKNFPKHLRWLCWHGFHLRSIPSDLYMENIVVIDMSYSKLEVFEPPMILQSLRILNLKDSQNLLKVRMISRLPNLETLNLSFCHMLVYVCETLGDLKNLTILDLTKCEKLFETEQTDPVTKRTISTFDQRITNQLSFSLPLSLEQVFLKECNLDDVPLSFSAQSFLRYLNLGNNLFELLPGYRHLVNLPVLDLTMCSIPSYSHLVNLRVLDLSMCSRLRRLISLPSTLAELYINDCVSLEKVTFESHRFTLQEFEYEGCINLSEVEGIFRLIPVSKLDEIDLSHMKWLKEYQNYEVSLVAHNELGIGRNCCVQMLYEFGIMSVSLPDIRDPNMTQHTSESPSLSFDVSPHAKNRRIIGLNVSFKYTIQADDSIWFAKISTANGVDMMYNPTVFGKPGSGEIGTWFSFWPIGKTLEIGDKVNVSIVVISGLDVIECGASLVYTYDFTNETFGNNVGWVETLGGDLSGFQLTTGAYYLCRRDLLALPVAGRLAPDWFQILVGDTDTVDSKEVQGWKINGRPTQKNPQLTEID